MSAQQLAEEIESIILDSVDEFTLQIEALQDRIYSRLATLLKDLEVDADGYILQNNANRRVLSEAEFLIEEYLPGQKLTEIVTNALLVIPQIEAINGDYFSGLDAAFKLNQAYIKNLQKQTIKFIESNLLNEGLASQVKNPLVNILQQNVNTGGTFSGMLEQLRNYIVGEPNEGKLLSYSRGLLTDTLFNYSRAFQQSVTADLKLEWYSYNGGTMDKTRPFCMERANNFYHQKEIESWAEQEWQGKIPGTTKSSIFIYCGGYNCRHQMIPVSDSIVPKEIREAPVAS